MSTTLPTPDAKAVPLSMLREGDRGRLHTAELPCEDCDLLNAMGLTHQCEVRVCRRGEPCIVQANSTRLGLSATLARRILITPTPITSAGTGTGARARAEITRSGP